MIITNMIKNIYNRLIIPTRFIHPVSRIVILILICDIILCINISIWKSNITFPIIFFTIIIGKLLIIFSFQY